eukprot:34260-Eustigmatos_ZCMA.PRE.1
MRCVICVEAAGFVAMHCSSPFRSSASVASEASSSAHSRERSQAPMAARTTPSWTVQSIITNSSRDGQFCGEAMALTKSAMSEVFRQKSDRHRVS